MGLNLPWIKRASGNTWLPGAKEWLAVSAYDSVADIAWRRFSWQRKRMSDSLQIVATGVLYYHDADERAFFEWLDRMAFVREYYGVVRDLFIKLNRFPTDDDLWEIIGFCRRYGIDMTQLAKFETNENRTWMRDPEMIWHAEIFGDLRNENGS